jgi:hypothetical protein
MAEPGSPTHIFGVKNTLKLYSWTWSKLCELKTTELLHIYNWNLIYPVGQKQVRSGPSTSAAIPTDPDGIKIKHEAGIYG